MRMKRWVSALLLVILLAQVLPFDALATVGKVLTNEELDRAYALTAGNSLWPMLSPMPTTERATPAPLSLFSISTPHIFLSPT